MSSSFGRLYRELKNQTSNPRPKDLTYVSEREAILQRLGHDPGAGYFTNPVLTPQYHGKLARIRRDSGLQLNKGKKQVDSKQAIAMKTNYNKICAETDDLLKITDELKESMNHGRRIPKDIVTKLSRHEKLYNARNGVVNVEEKKKIKPIERVKPIKEEKGPFDTIPVCFMRGETYTVKGAKNIKNREFTTNKWSSEERTRLSLIYQDMSLPSIKNSLELWRLYFKAFCDRFLAFFPKRTEEETIDKIQEFISARKMKEIGEVIYWEGVQPRIKSR